MSEKLNKKWDVDPKDRAKQFKMDTPKTDQNRRMAKGGDLIYCTKCMSIHNKRDTGVRSCSYKNYKNIYIQVWLME